MRPSPPSSMSCPCRISTSHLRSITQALCGGGRVLHYERPDALNAEPAVVRMPSQTEVMKDETFAPILYVVTYSDLDEALEIHNAVPQGLSSAIFTSELAESERFISR